MNRRKPKRIEIPVGTRVRFARDLPPINLGYETMPRFRSYLGDEGVIERVFADGEHHVRVGNTTHRIKADAIASGFLEVLS